MRDAGHARVYDREVRPMNQIRARRDAEVVFLGAAFVREGIGVGDIIFSVDMHP
jgi:hypothetical protein